MIFVWKGMPMRINLKITIIVWLFGHSFVLDIKSFNFTLLCDFGNFSIFSLFNLNRMLSCVQSYFYHLRVVKIINLIFIKDLGLYI